MAKNSSDKNSPSKWRQRIESAKEYRDFIAKRDRWQQIHEEYKGNFKETLGSHLGHAPIIPINMVFPYVHSLIPMLYYRDPYFAVNPRKKTSVLSSKIMESVLNYEWQELEIKQEYEPLLVEAICAGHSWMKVGYGGSVATSDDAKDSDVPSLEVNEYIRDGEVFASWESWKNIVFDPGSVKPLRDTRWLAHKIYRATEAVKESKLYENTDDLQPSMYSSEVPEMTQGYSMTKNGDRHKTSDIPMSVLWEIWDRDSNQVYTMAEGHEKYLRSDQWYYPFIDGFPFEMLAFNVVPGEPYPLSDVLPWENLMFEQIKLRSLQLDHIKRFGRQIFSKKGSLSPSEIDKFKQGLTGSIIEYKKEVPIIMQYPAIQTDMYAVDNSIKFDMDNVSGQSNIIRGGTQKLQSRTLGELDKLVEFAQNRSSKKQDVLRNFTERIARKLVQLLKEYSDSEGFARIVGDSKNEILRAFSQSLGQDRVTSTGIVYSREEIKGEYDVSVKIGSEMPLDKHSRMELLMQALKVSPAIGIAPGSMASKTIGLALMRDFDLKEVEIVLEKELSLNQELAALQSQVAQGREAVKELTVEVGRKRQELSAIQNAAASTGQLAGAGNGQFGNL